MKNLHLSSFFFLILLVAACHIPIPASAIQPRGTTMTGTITAVDHSTRSITFQQISGKGGKGTRHFVYAHRAQFWHHAPDTSPTTLRPGMHIQIDLHDPFFGPDFVTHIVLLMNAPPVKGNHRGL